ncbi:MAG: hydantoinase B/oxoprolinase family protein [Clostridia bacterium]|nr:hydantoinase B/oxoprolinase family protein [Clostridia bacterium]
MDETANIVWDGVARGYIPPVNLRISPSLKLHTQGATDVDPITYEVIRNTFTSINLEHGQTIQKLSISPITMIVRDFQCAILTEQGDVMCLGPYLLYLGNMQGIFTKWILENRSGDPGIKEGDVFLCNDPYVGTSHQQDTGLTCPVFWNGELFCWVSNSVHYSDVGGPVPGSFCLTSQNIHEDPPCFPPIKLVEGGKIRTDVEQLFLRQSRIPQTVAMDLHAALAGLRVAQERIVKLIKTYGPDIVKGVMNRMMDAGERAIEKKLELIPDGRWSERVYTEAAVPGDRGIYVSRINIVKENGYLYIDNQGTSPQVGSINNTFAGLVGACLAPLTIMLAYDLGGICGGLYRRIKFRPVPGTITCADYPAAISTAGVFNMPMVVATATGAVSKMVACADSPLREKAIAMADVHAYGGCIFNGINQYEQFFVGMSAGMASGALPASLARDGVDTGGLFWVPGMEASNVEENELAWPVLTLYRRENAAEEAGAGRFRSGLGVEEAWILHGTDRMDMQIYMNDSFVKNQGLLGGNSGGRAFFKVKRNTNARQYLAEGKLPQSFDELNGDDAPIFFKGPPVNLEVNDIWSTNLPNFAGYGDPLDRDPTLVVQDVSQGKMTVEAAQKVYGVVFKEGGLLDIERTEACRAGRKQQRLF